ncbi:hypothetical protein SAMN05216170_2285 [Thermococcus thioreducens]|uniref:Uncharacterized protein n=1 Tax=Thermococcus thioreducens TaxID=277988 RepID=A0A1I0Q822_9EURY|nr:hypothetical protein SAMN05216170_2285 [Thermococcus thioreducens]
MSRVEKAIAGLDFVLMLALFVFMIMLFGR